MIKMILSSWAERFLDTSSLDTMLAKLGDKDRPLWA